jgi:hypothetical protein
LPQTLHKLCAFPPLIDSMQEFHAVARLLPLLLLAGGCNETAPAAAASCADDAAFSVELYGDMRTNLNWAGAELECDGMPRPFGDGARLRFAGPAGTADASHRLAFIVALPALERGAPANELPATVTLMEEGNGRFYSNQDSEVCWSDVTAQEPVAESGDDYVIRGIVYCMAPLPELNGDGSVTLRELRYSGRVSWRSAES